MDYDPVDPAEPQPAQLPPPPQGYTVRAPTPQQQPTASQSAQPNLPPPPKGYSLRDSQAFGPFGPSFPSGAGGHPTQEQTDASFRSLGRTALDYVPAVAATAGALFAPEAVLPAMGYAALGGGVGEAVRQGALAAGGDPEAPKSFGDAAVNVGKSAAIQGAMELGGRAVAWPIEKLAAKYLSPAAMYGRELKPSTSLKPSEANARIATGIRENIAPSVEGYEQVGQRAHEVSRAMEDIVRNSPQAHNAMVNPVDIADRLQQLGIDSPWAKQALNEGDLSALRTARTQYLQKHGAVYDSSGNMVTPPKMMTPVETMEEKQATYQVNRQKYEAAQKGGATVGAATDAAEKALARGAKDHLIAIYPELKELGERDGALIDLEDSLRQFVGRERNRSGIGLRSVVLGGAAAAGLASGHTETGIGVGMLGLALNALDDPAIKGKLAIALARAGASPLGRAAQKLKPSTTLPMSIRMGQAIWNAQPQQGTPGVK